MIPGLLDYIKKNHKEKTAEEMAEHLGTSVNYVEAVCKHNNLSLRNPHWSDREITILKAKYSTRPMDEILESLPGRDKKSIWVKASSLGITRHKEEPVNS